jgi:hypothetical protein
MIALMALVALTAVRPFGAHVDSLFSLVATTL